MTKFRLALTATLLTGAAFTVPALAAGTAAIQNSNSTQTAMTMPSSSGSMSSDASATQRKGAHLSKSQKQAANMAEAQTTKQLNQQAASMAAPGNGT